MHAVNRRLQFFCHAAIANFLRNADDRVPVSLATPVSELEFRAEWRTSGVVAICKGFVDDRHRRSRLSVRRIEESAFAQTCPDSGEVIPAHDARERDLFAGLVVGLALENIKSRLVVYRQRNSRNRASVHYAGNCADLFQLRVDKGHALVEVGMAEQWSHKGQYLVTVDSEIEPPQVLEGLQQQTTDSQQHDCERRLDDDERMLEPSLARAGTAAAAVAQSFV